MNHTLTAPTDHPPQSIAGKLSALAGDIKLAHSVFALPFALLAAFLAAASVDEPSLPGLWQIVLVLLSMFFARCVAMLSNRWADAKIDAANPRTAHRAVASGRVPRPFALNTMLACCGLLVLCSAGFLLTNEPPNPWPLIASIPVLGWLITYSFTKRFTPLCHVFLGVALALSPLAAALAIAPAYLLSVEPYLLAGMVALWVAGFDVIYALQDVAVDREAGLHSLPADLGESSAMWLARLMHVAAVACLLGLWASSSALGWGFLIAVGGVALLLIVEHALVWDPTTNRIKMAFFTVNGVISVLLGLVGIAEAAWWLLDSTP